MMENNFIITGIRRIVLVEKGEYPEKKTCFRTHNKSNELIFTDPEPLIAVKEHGASSVNLTCFVWCSADEYWNVFYYMQEQVKLAFDKKGISIPFNQLDIHISKED